MRLVDFDQHLLADLEGQRSLLDLGAAARFDHLEGGDRQRVAALEVELLAGLGLELGEAALGIDPSQVGQGTVRISRTPSVTFWRVISTSPSGETSTT